MRTHTTSVHAGRATNPATIFKLANMANKLSNVFKPYQFIADSFR
jgi:hypothetical protein